MGSECWWWVQTCREEINFRQKSHRKASRRAARIIKSAHIRTQPISWPHVSTLPPVCLEDGHSWRKDPEKGCRPRAIHTRTQERQDISTPEQQNTRNCSRWQTPAHCQRMNGQRTKDTDQRTADIRARDACGRGLTWAQLSSRCDKFWRPMPSGDINQPRDLWRFAQVGVRDKDPKNATKAAWSGHRLLLYNWHGQHSS